MKRKPYSITQLNKGVNVNLSPAFLQDAEATEVTQCRFDKGLLKKEYGMIPFGLPLLGTPMLLDTYYKNNGSSYFLAFTTTSVYQWNSTTSEWDDISPGYTVVDSGETTWTASASVTCTRDTDCKRGTYSAKAAIAVGFTTGLAAYHDITPVDLTGVDQLHLWIKSSVATAAGDLQLLLDDTSGCVSALETLDLPALVANTWTRVSLTLTTPASLGVVASVGLNVATDNGAQDVYLDDICGVNELTGTSLNFFCSATCLDTYAFCNGVDAIMTYDGTSIADLTGSPPTSCRAMIAWQNRLILGDTTESGVQYRQRIRWSSIGTMTTWSGGTSGYLDISDISDWIMTLKLLKSKCFIYTDYSIYELLYQTTTPYFTVVRTMSIFGTEAPRSLVDMGEYHMFYSAGNIVLFDGTYKVGIGDNIFPWMYQTESKIVDGTYVAQVNGIYAEENKEFILAIPHESVYFKYNEANKAWLRFNDKAVSCLGWYFAGATAYTWTSVPWVWSTATGSWGRSSIVSKAPTVLYGFTNGQIYEDDRTTASTDELTFTTKDFIWAHHVRIMECRVDYQYGPFYLSYSTDSGTTWSAEQLFDYSSSWKEVSLPINVSAGQVRFKIRCTASTLEVRWIEPWYIERVRTKELQYA